MEEDMTDAVLMTRSAYDKRKAELDRLENEVMPSIAEKIAAAREEGDLKENAEYHYQREEQGRLQAKINQMRGQLASARIIDPTESPRDEVGFGATVLVRDLDLDDEETITLVGHGDEDYDTGKYLMTSPLGQGLAGKKVGDKVEIPVPKGTINFEILEINYED